MPSIPLARVAGFVLLLAFGLALGAPRSAAAEIEEGAIAYKHGDLELEGFLARPKDEDGKQPGVLLVHAWRGHGDNVRQKARQLAQEGYVAFALDMYGKGVYAKDNDEARQFATGFYQDRPLMRARARAGLDVLRSQPDVDPKRIAAIGFCFGGTTVLELARDGADIAGVVSFHGGLTTTAPAEKGAVKTKILVAHGGDDPYVPPKDVLAFWEEMKAAGADYQLLVLSDAVHSFTDPGAGDDPSGGAAYAKSAHQRSWQAMRRFFSEILP